jgi:hypothetical protein
MSARILPFLARILPILARGTRFAQEFPFPSQCCAPAVNRRRLGTAARQTKTEAKAITNKKPKTKETGAFSKL